MTWFLYVIKSLNITANPGVRFKVIWWKGWIITIKKNKFSIQPNFVLLSDITCAFPFPFDIDLNIWHLELTANQIKDTQITELRN